MVVKLVVAVWCRIVDLGKEERGKGREKEKRVYEERVSSKKM